MAEKKHTPFILLRILQDETDENHPLSASRLIDRIFETSGIMIERRTLYSNIEILRQAGYEISDQRDNGKGYYICSRQFEKGEVLLLCNAVHASHFINQTQSRDLIDKLLATQSRYGRQEFRDSVYIPNKKKTQSRTLFYNIELISEAIRDSRSISFTYMHYNKNKKLVARRNEPYVLEPRYIVYSDSRPYLIATNTKHPGFSHWRLDKISGLTLLDEPARKLPREKKLEAYEYAGNKLFMFAGENIWVTFRCQNRIMDQMIDIFGPEVKILPGDDDFFILRVLTSRAGALFLAQQFLDAVELTDPAAVKEEVKEYLKKALEIYQ
ncbi:MAG: WYL domain-containing protein [Solobacterium sp.]|nr:WYL domain-containing protein [Solobacterium sp.]